MARTRSFAPADHFSPERLRVRDLHLALTSLRRALPLLQRVAAGAHHGLLSAMAALLAYLPTHALGLREGFWSAITAISVVQSEFRATQSTARDQFIGAAIGGGTAVCAWLAFGQHLVVYAGAVVVSMLTCGALNVPTASRLAGITATMILLVPRVGAPQSMFAARLGEVGWGVCVAVVVVWLAARLPALHATRRQVAAPPAPPQSAADHGH